jgi:hypothetical protein
MRLPILSQCVSFSITIKPWLNLKLFFIIIFVMISLWMRTNSYYERYSIQMYLIHCHLIPSMFPFHLQFLYCLAG